MNDFTVAWEPLSIAVVMANLSALDGREVTACDGGIVLPNGKMKQGRSCHYSSFRVALGPFPKWQLIGKPGALVIW